MASKASCTVFLMIYKMHASWGHHSHTLTCYEVWIEVTGSAWRPCMYGSTHSWSLLKSGAPLRPISRPGQVEDM